MVRGNRATFAAPQVVVAAFDFSEAGECALSEGLGIAERCPDTQLYPTHVTKAYGPMLELEQCHKVELLDVGQAEARLSGFVEQHRLALASALDPDRVHPCLRVGGPAVEIVMLAAELLADLVVVGTRGRCGMRRLLAGSVAESVVRHGGCPVLVVRPKGYAAWVRP
jgi:nucleotide-binding universal stress UspA family protein